MGKTLTDVENKYIDANKCVNSTSGPYEVDVFNSCNVVTLTVCDVVRKITIFFFIYDNGSPRYSKNSTKLKQFENDETTKMFWSETRQ